MSVPQVVDASLPLSTPFVTYSDRHFVCEVTLILGAENLVICLHYSLRIPTLHSSWQKYAHNETEMNLLHIKRVTFVLDNAQNLLIANCLE
jgi:hypothetical protein